MKKQLVLLTLMFISIPLWMHAQKSAKPMNIIFILADDHRYDFMGFMNAVPGLQTPGMDRMAKEGAHIKKAFVTTALCSPSRASILTGQYAHTHRVVDNSAPLPDNLIFFPQYLQKKGYQLIVHVRTQIYFAPDWVSTNALKLSRTGHFKLSYKPVIIIDVVNVNPSLVFRNIQETFYRGLLNKTGEENSKENL